MKDVYKIDLKVARQQSGLSNQDIAILLDCSTARVSKLENGYARPKVREVIAFSLIYGQTIDSLFSLTASRLTETLKQNLAELDFDHDNKSVSSKKRLDVLNNLMARLTTLDQRDL